MSWIRLADSQRSTENYTRERTLREHDFKLECKENRSFDILRIDVADRHYLDYLNLVYIQEGEEKAVDPGGVQSFGINSHFLYLKPKAGNYKIRTKGAQYTFSILGLEGDTSPSLVYKICSPFDVLVAVKKHDCILDMRVFYRAEGEEDFSVAASKFQYAHIRWLDGEKTYEFKVQLFIQDLIETKMSEIVKITAAPIFANYKPDEFLLAAALKFVVAATLPNSCYIILQIRSPFGEWIQFKPSTKPREDDDEYNDELTQPIFRLEDALYDKLTEDRVVEWQLIFEQNTTLQRICGPITPVLLTKRPKGYGALVSSMHFGGGSLAFHLCKNGQFGYFPNEVYHGRKTLMDLRGRYVIDGKEGDYMDLTLYPQTYFNRPIYDLTFGADSYSNHEIFSLPDLIDIILNDVITPQNKVMSFASIFQVNLVSKEWYESLRRVLKLRAYVDYSDEEGAQLVVSNWLQLFEISDVQLFSDFNSEQFDFNGEK